MRKHKSQGINNLDDFLVIFTVAVIIYIFYLILQMAFYKLFSWFDFFLYWDIIFFEILILIIAEKKEKNSNPTKPKHL